MRRQPTPAQGSARHTAAKRDQMRMESSRIVAHQGMIPQGRARPRTPPWYRRRMAKVHGGRLVSKALARHGITHLFTLCGGHIQAIYDGCLDDNIRVVDVRHEQTAGHAADGYARVTGRPGVCAVTAGPGVTDVVTAVANAHRAGIPMVILGGAGPNLLADMGS